MAIVGRASTSTLPAPPSNSFNHSFQIKSFTSCHANEVCIAILTDAMSLRDGMVVGLLNFVLF